MADEPTLLPPSPPPPCPHCGAVWSPGATVCPHCGYLYPRVPAWPPRPTGLTAPLPPTETKMVTGKVWGDVTFGFLLSFLSNFVFCVGFLVMPILYFTQKPKYPFFARGLGLGTLIGLVVLVLGGIALVAGLLGALARCKPI